MSMNPRMLVLAREAQGLTQEELARSTGWRSQHQQGREGRPTVAGF